MTDDRYANREIDQLFKAADQRADEFHNRLMERMDTFETDVRESLTRIEVKADGIDAKVAYTNGKVRKIIISIVLLAGIVIGQNFPDWREVIGLLAGSAGL